MRLLLLIEARPFISYPHNYLVVAALDTDRDRSLSRAVFEGIGDQVVQDLLDAGLVPGADDTLFAAFQPDTTLASCLLLLDDAPDQRNDVDVFLVIELEQFAADARQVAHLINETIHAPDLLDNTLQSLYLLLNTQWSLLRLALGRAVPGRLQFAQEAFGLTQYGRQGGAQFVAGKGEEIVLYLVQPLDLAARLHLLSDLNGGDEHETHGIGPLRVHDRRKRPVPDAFLAILRRHLHAHFGEMYGNMALQRRIP